MNALYMPAPSRNAAALTVHTPRMRIIFMSTSGSDERLSTVTHTTRSTMPSSEEPERCAGRPSPTSSPG